MSDRGDWDREFALDIHHGLVGVEVGARLHDNPRLVLNGDGATVEHTLLEELGRSSSFTFSVAFISPSAIAQLKQHFLDFAGSGRIITSDFLGFNQPQAFAELLNLSHHTEVDVRLHSASAFHPKGYIFERPHSISAMIGSSNLTSNALSQNHEWNIKVSAASGSDLAGQFERLIASQLEESVPLTQEWIDRYAESYVAPPRRTARPVLPPEAGEKLDATEAILPNLMQQDALLAIDLVRAGGASRAIIISATGTGKTILSALDVRSVSPKRLLFVVHREQILDRTIQAYQQVLGGQADDYGKLTGSFKQQDRRYVFATIQTLSQPGTLASIDPDTFDYVIIDEAHRTGSGTYQRVIEHLTPEFLLGMTATPERTDGFNVFELFHHNVPYEIRLNHALESGMLSPFHYYGVSDLIYGDDTAIEDDADLRVLITPERVDHLVTALETYGQAGVAPRGLIFCSRKEEAKRITDELNRRTLRGQTLRTVALTGDDSVEFREECVARLEEGELDYILTVDIFNEGVDIPSINQVVMLRQTQSAIVFVQQLGRGLRLAERKEYLVVIDFIGNYSNNFLIPIALFGDETLNRESLRKRLNETVEGGSLPGLSSVSFDEISRERILQSITNTKLDSMANLKTALLGMQARVGGVPKLADFYRFESVDPVVLATAKEHYPALVKSLLRVDHDLTPDETRALGLLSHEVLTAKRLHELVLLRLLLEGDVVTLQDITAAFADAGIDSSSSHVASALDTLLLRGYSQGDALKFRVGVAELQGDSVRMTEAFSGQLATSSRLAAEVEDLVHTGTELTRSRYSSDSLFTPGMQYSRRDAARFVGWPRSTASTIYGYKTDVLRGVCTIFVTLHKSDDIEATTAYEDALLDPSTMRWFSRNKRTLKSEEVRAVAEERVDVHVFVKKDDADGSDHYYLGQASAYDAIETTIPNAKGDELSIVRMDLKFVEPIKQGLFDYFSGTAHR